MLNPRSSFRIKPKVLTAWHPGISASPVRHVPLQAGILRKVPGGLLQGKATRSYPAVHLMVLQDSKNLLGDVREVLAAFAALSSLSLSPKSPTPKRHLHVAAASVRART